MTYQLALFDFDGTLADSAYWFYQRLNELADEFKFRRIEEADFEKLRGSSSHQVIKHLAIPMWRLPIIMSRLRRAAALDHDAIRLFPGVDQMLSSLEQRGLRLGIVSSNAEPNIRRILGEENATRFQYFACGASLFGKAIKLRAVLRKSGLPPNQVIYIGDEIRDATAARELGVSFGAVAWGYTTIEALRAEHPALEFSTVAELAGKLESV